MKTPAWPMGKRQIVRRKYCSVLSALFPIVNGPSCYVDIVVLFSSQFSQFLTSLERFMSLSTLITVVLSLSCGLARLAAPSVRKTDRMFLKPKS